MKKLNTIFQPLALQSYLPFAKAEASCTHISCVNALRCAWDYKTMMTRSIMQRCSNHVVWQNTVFNHTKNEMAEKNFITNHTNNKMMWESVRTRHTKQLVRCRNDTTAACCTIVHLKRCMPTTWVGASAI